MGSWRRETGIAMLWSLAALMLSLFIGHAAALLLVVAVALLIVQSRRVAELEKWLSRGALGDTPNAKGIWEDIYYHLYKIKKNEKRRKKKLSKMIDQFRKSTDALPDAAVVLGKHGEIEWSNKAAYEVLGLKKSDRGQRIPNLIRSPQFIQYLKEQDYTQKISILSPVNDRIILQISIVPYGAGLRLMTAQDITQLKNMERIRRDFVANVSHELRTPLTVLKGYLETLQENDADPASLSSRSFQQMARQTDRMQALIDDLLLLARLETKDKKSECINVPELLTSICQESDRQRIRLTLDAAANNVQGDALELRSAFTNLIGNALKYSSDDTLVDVSWAPDAGGVSLSVIDRGEGIALHDIPKITERFYRVDVKRSVKIQGTGLGLSIVKHVLARHDAKLHIDSELGKGSCFRCIFPVKRLC